MWHKAGRMELGFSERERAILPSHPVQEQWQALSESLEGGSEWPTWLWRRFEDQGSRLLKGMSSRVVSDLWLHPSLRNRVSCQFGKTPPSLTWVSNGGGLGG